MMIIKTASCLDSHCSLSAQRVHTVLLEAATSCKYEAEANKPKSSTGVCVFGGRGL